MDHTSGSSLDSSTDPMGGPQFATPTFAADATFADASFGDATFGDATGDHQHAPDALSAAEQQPPPESTSHSPQDFVGSSMPGTEAIEFRVIRPGAPVRRLRLTGNRYTFGSAEGCSIRLSDHALRPMHAVLIRDASRILVRAYSVPIQVNGVRTTEATLQVGDVLRLGAYQFELLSAAKTHGSTFRPKFAPPPRSVFDEPANAFESTRRDSTPNYGAAKSELPARDDVIWRERLRREIDQWRDRQDECDRRESRCDEREADLRGRESELWSRAEHLYRRESRLQSQEAAAFQLYDEFNQRQEELLRLREETNLRQQDFQQREAEFRRQEFEYRRRLEEATRQLQQSQQQAETATEAVGRMRVQFESLNRQIEELSQQQEQIETREQHQRDEHEQLRLKLEKSRDQAIDAQAESEVRRQESEARVQEMAAQIESLQSDQGADLQDQHARLEASERVAEQLREQVAELQKSVSQASEESARVRRDYEEACESVRQLEAIVSKSTERGDQDRQSWAAEADELRAAVDQLSVDLARAGSELSDLRQANDQLSARLEAMQGERDEARADAESRPTSEEFESVRNELDAANGQLHEIKRDYEESLAKLEQAERDAHEEKLRASSAAAAADAMRAMPVAERDEEEPASEQPPTAETSVTETHCEAPQEVDPQADPQADQEAAASDPWSADKPAESWNDEAEATSSATAESGWGDDDDVALDPEPEAVASDPEPATDSAVEDWADDVSPSQASDEVAEAGDDASAIWESDDEPNDGPDHDPAPMEQTVTWDDAESVQTEGELPVEPETEPESTVSDSPWDQEDGDQQDSAPAWNVDAAEGVDAADESGTEHQSESDASVWGESPSTDSDHQPDWPSESPAMDDSHEGAGESDWDTGPDAVVSDPADQSDDPFNSLQNEPTDAQNPAEMTSVWDEAGPELGTEHESDGWSEQADAEPSEIDSQESGAVADADADSSYGDAVQDDAGHPDLEGAAEESDSLVDGSLASMLIQDIEAESSEHDASNDDASDHNASNDDASNDDASEHDVEQDVHGGTYVMDGQPDAASWDDAGAEVEDAGDGADASWDREYAEESRASEWSNDPEGYRVEEVDGAGHLDELEEEPVPDADFGPTDVDAAIVDDEQSPQSSQPEPTPEPLAEGVDDDSIEAYMNRLLQRVQAEPGSESPEAETVSVSTSVSQTAGELVYETTSETENETPEESSVEAVDPDAPLVPRSQAPEKNSDLSAMRELANASARSAISRSVRIQTRNTQIQGMVSFLCAAGALICGLVLFLFLPSVVPMAVRVVAAAMTIIVALIYAKEGMGHFQLAKQRMQAAEQGLPDPTANPEPPTEADLLADGEAPEPKSSKSNSAQSESPADS